MNCGRKARERLGLRRPSAAFEHASHSQSGGGPPQSKTWRKLERFMENLQFRKRKRIGTMNRKSAGAPTSSPALGGENKGGQITARADAIRRSFAVSQRGRWRSGSRLAPHRDPNSRLANRPFWRRPDVECEQGDAKLYSQIVDSARAPTP